jgi:hypothetical protein
VARAKRAACHTQSWRGYDGGIPSAVWTISLLWKKRIAFWMSKVIICHVYVMLVFIVWRLEQDEVIQQLRNEYALYAKRATFLLNVLLVGVAAL